jgi:hypothetical protein
MQRPKTQAMLFLLGAVLVGGVLGFTADRALAGPPRRVNQRFMREQLHKDLALTPGQARLVDSILDARNERMRAITAPLKPALDAVRDSARMAIRARLTPEQQGRWDAVLQEMQANGREGR